MLDENKLKRIERRIPGYLRDGLITKNGEQKFVEFFLRNARNSLKTAEMLADASPKEPKDPEEYDGSLWVINAGYYSMFYAARALLESAGIEIKTEQSVHGITFDAVVYYFYLNGKLEKKFVEDFAEATEEAAELLGREKARELVESYMQERNKRGTFTYKTGAVAMKNKAVTSLERARKFNAAIRGLIRRNGT